MTARIEDALNALVDASLTTGLQLALASRESEVTTYEAGSDAMGSRLTADSVSSWFCTTKLLVAALTLELAERGGCSMSDLLGDELPWLSEELQAMSVWDVLTFQTGLWGDAAERLMLFDRSTRSELYTDARPRRRRAFEGIYGEYIGFDVLGFWLEARTGRPLAELLHDYVLCPADVREDVNLAAPLGYAGLAISSAATDNGYQVPCLAEALTEAIEHASAANGAYATARGFARFGQYLLDRRGEPASLVGLIGRQCTRPGRDPVLGRTCSFGAGSWFGLRRHAFDPSLVSATSFGMSALGGSATVVVDPERDVVVAWRDMVVHDDLEALLLVRQRITEACLDAR